jgi:hypothetical protein
MKLLKFNEFVKTISENYSELVYSKDLELFCGAAYGHLEHPFEDLGLTFLDLEEMLMATVNGAFGPENFLQTKTDGQNLMISWKGGKLIAARNKSHLKNYGESALDIKSISQLFAGRGEIEASFTEAMRDLSASISTLSEKDRQKFFNEGQKFASVEIITPATQNTVPYGQDLLVFHGIVGYDETGNSIGEDKQAGRDIGRLIADVNAQVQRRFFVRGPEDLPIKPLPNTKARAKYYSEKLSQIMRESGSCYTAPSPSTSTESTLPVSPLSVSSPSVASSQTWRRKRGISGCTSCSRKKLGFAGRRATHGQRIICRGCSKIVLVHLNMTSRAVSTI